VQHFHRSSSSAFAFAVLRALANAASCYGARDMKPGKQYMYGDTPVLARPAAGVKGCLIRTIDSQILFRVYHDAEHFTDYEIRHDDLSVTIDEAELAAFYTGSKGNVLDHGPEVLGLEGVREW
jgi:hypothetical protein